MRSFLFVLLLTFVTLPFSAVADETKEAGIEKKEKDTNQSAEIDISCAKEDPALEALLIEVKRQVREHDWDGYLELCSGEHKEIQLGEFGQEVPQYIFESIGLDIWALGIQSSWDTLNKIQDIEYESCEKGTLFRVQGTLTLSDGSSAPFSLFLIKSDGRWWISGALG